MELRGKEQEVLIVCWCSRGTWTRTGQNLQDVSVFQQKCSQKLGVFVMKVTVLDTVGLQEC